MEIKSIIGPAVIAAIISGIISYLSLWRKGNLQYITQERKEWREKMREIASALDGATYKKTLKILTKLKVRINAYGDENNYRYDEDGHIWKSGTSSRFGCLWYNTYWNNIDFNGV